MRKGLSIRTVTTASGATAVQIMKHQDAARIIVKHIGSAHTADELIALKQKATLEIDELLQQSSLFSEDKTISVLNLDHLILHAVTHDFAYKALRLCSKKCGLGSMPSLYQDLALMRIIEPASKLRTLELLNRYFQISYAERTVYRQFAKLLQYKENIETAAYRTAVTHFDDPFALVLGCWGDSPVNTR